MSYKNFQKKLTPYCDIKTSPYDLAMYLIIYDLIPFIHLFTIAVS